MRPVPGPAPGWARLLGTIAIVVLPVLAAVKVRGYLSHGPAAAQDAAIFLLAALGGQFGLILRRWGKINGWRLVFDVLLAAAAGLIVYGVEGLARRQGGGPVDPSLVAVILAYILAVFSGQQR